MCPTCNTLPEDWFDEDGKLALDPVWAPVERWCPGDAEIDRFKKHHKTDEKPGAFVALVPFESLDLEEPEP